MTQLAEPTEQEVRQMREEIEEAQKEKSRAYHRQYSREYRARNLEKQREYERMKAREYRARRKAQAAAAAARTVKQNNRQPRGIFRATGSPSFRARRKEPPMAEQTPDSIITTQRERADHRCGVVFQSQRHRNIPRQAAQERYLPTVRVYLQSDGQEPEKSEILR